MARFAVPPVAAPTLQWFIDGCVFDCAVAVVVSEYIKTSIDITIYEKIAVFILPDLLFWPRTPPLGHRFVPSGRF